MRYVYDVGALYNNAMSRFGTGGLVCVGVRETDRLREP